MFCYLLLQSFKRDEPIKKDTYEITAILTENRGGILEFKTTSIPEQSLIDYFNEKTVGSSVINYKGPWYFRNIKYDEANRFFEKDTNDQYLVKDTFQLQCKILPDDQLPPGPVFGFMLPYAHLKIVEIKPYK